jgi:hypothetical protein
MICDEIGSLLMILSLYILQGVPLGLVSGSLPFLIKDRMGYSEIAVFSLAIYPFSLKFFWSPFVDSYFFEAWGRRKSWIIPMQVVSGSLMILLSFYIEELLMNPEKIWQMTFYLFLIVLVFATQDIAVDSWGVEMLKPESRSLVSTCNSIGQSIGFFSSYTLFLTLSSADFCNKYIFSEKQEKGLLSLESYLFFWGLSNWIICFFVILKPENPCESSLSPKEIFKKVSELLKTSKYQLLVLVLITSKIGLAVFDSALGLVLHEKGVKEADLGLLAALGFPFELIIGAAVGLLVKKINNDLTSWYFGMISRVLACLFSFIFLIYFPKTGLDPFLFFVLFALMLFASFSSNLYFISMCSYFSKVSQGPMTGTVYTFLTTASNFGGSTSAFFALKAIAFFSVEEKCEKLCEDCENICVEKVHGFYIVAYFSFLLCFLNLVGIRRVFKKLEKVEWGDSLKKE